MVECSLGKALGLDGLPCKLYKSMLDLLGHVLASVFMNGQQNGLIS